MRFLTSTKVSFSYSTRLLFLSLLVLMKIMMMAVLFPGLIRMLT